MENANFVKKLKEIRGLDSRHTYAEFFFTFDLDNFYTDSMVYLIMSGKRRAKKEHFSEFLTRCLQVYENNTKDYSYYGAEQLTFIKKEFEKRHKVHVTNDMLSRYIGYNPTLISIALSGKGKFLPDVWDCLSLDLLPTKRAANSFIENVGSYKELQRRLMRAEIFDGNKILTVKNVADETGIPLETLKHLDTACHDVDTYKDVYSKLVSFTPEYNF